MNLDSIASNLQQIAGLIGSLTVVGSALIWVYNKFIGRPREKKRLEHEEKQQKILTDALKPINQFIEESRSDRKALNQIAIENKVHLKEHDVKIAEMDDRLIIVETLQGVDGQTRKHYTEVYKGKENK